MSIGEKRRSSKTVDYEAVCGSSLVVHRPAVREFLLLGWTRGGVPVSDLVDYSSFRRFVFFPLEGIACCVVSGVHSSGPRCSFV
jgi:hypothetical protein